MTDSPRTITRADAEAYMNRDWDAVARAKAAYRAQQFRDDWRRAWADAQELRRYASRLAPVPEYVRQEDLRSHIVLKALLDRAADAISRR